MLARLLSEWRFRRFLSRSRKAERLATATREIGRIRAQRQATVHAALARVK